MRNITLILLFLSAICYAENDKVKFIKDLGGEVTITEYKQEVIGNQCFTSFEVIAKPGAYFLNVWMIPSQLRDGTFNKYEVVVNGNTKGTINPILEGWQGIGLSDNKKITLKNGKNIISIVSILPEMVQVEFIRLATVSKNAKIKSSKYEELYEKAKKIVCDSISVLRTSNSSENEVMLRSYQMPNPYGNYYHQMDVDLAPTFCSPYYFNAGQQIFIATTGVDNFAHELFLYSYNNPEIYSWNSVSNSSCLASINITIPTTGYYYVLVVSKNNLTMGLTNLNVNGQYYYNNILLSRTEYKYTQDNQRVYNTFTCYNKNIDPCIWITEGLETPVKVAAFNDNFVPGTTGSYYWGVNSRIKKQFLRPVHGVLLANNSSYNPYGKCDLYVGCQNSTAYAWFPNLTADDAIQSAPASLQYNCISWSGGITEYWEWPCSPFSLYYVQDNDLASFDMFYTSMRYDSCALYTRNGANWDNAVIDLWGINMGSYIDYTHASIKKGADAHPHGYNWESKPGSLMRTFHPRNSLSGDNGYGIIQKHYVRYGTGYAYTLAEAIAEGLVILRTVQYSSIIKDIFAAEKANMTTSEKEAFTSKYNTWKATWSNSKNSNPNKFKNYEYQEIIDFCNAVAGANYLAFEKVEEDAMALILVDALTLYSPNNRILLNEVKNSNIALRAASLIDIVTPPQSTCVEYISRMITQLRSSKSTEQSTDVKESYSNSTEMEIFTIKNNISIEFSLQVNAKNVILDVVDLRGNILKTIVNDQNLNSGDYHYSIDISEKGVYLVRLIIDNIVNIKKVIVN